MGIDKYSSLTSCTHRKLWLQGFLEEQERRLIIDAAMDIGCNPVALGMLINMLNTPAEEFKAKAEAIHKAVQEMRQKENTNA